MSSKVALDIASKWNIPACARDAVFGVSCVAAFFLGTHIDVPIHLNPTPPQLEGHWRFA